jgi:PIN domain nuclease of toxin-antitoxin system
MRMLLDTHIALWAISDSPRLPGRARELILTPANWISVSAASVWEIAIKHGLGRGDMPLSGDEALGYFLQSGYAMLSISPQHAAAVDQLPPHHRDPFDRLLVAQAISEPLRLLTQDPMVASYSDMVILV